MPLGFHFKLLGKFYFRRSKKFSILIYGNMILVQVKYMSLKLFCLQLKKNYLFLKQYRISQSFGDELIVIMYCKLRSKIMHHFTSYGQSQTIPSRPITIHENLRVCDFETLGRKGLIFLICQNIFRD